jgi:hypothetical protein
MANTGWHAGPSGFHRERSNKDKTIALPGSVELEIVTSADLLRGPVEGSFRKRDGGVPAAPSGCRQDASIIDLGGNGFPWGPWPILG